MKSLITASVVALSAAATQAAPFFDNLEGATPVGTTRTSGATDGSVGFSAAGEPARDSRSYRLSINSTNPGYARLSYTATPGPAFGKLRDVTATFETYLSPSNSQALTPYVLLGLDNNGDGTYDSATESLVIQFTNKNPTPATGTWLTEGLDATSGVHVQVNRGMLPNSGPGNYQPDETPDGVAALYDTSYNGSTLWGDLDVRFARIAFGNFAPTDPAIALTAFVDNVNVVPEPASLGLIGVAAAGLLMRRRRVVR